MVCLVPIRALARRCLTSATAVRLEVRNGGVFGGLAGNQAGLGNRNTVGIQTTTQEQYQQFSAINEQLRIANQRMAAYDSDNQELNTELAASSQKLQLANQYSQTLKDQLSDTADQIRLAQNERQSAMQQLASTRLQLQQSNQNQQRLAQQNNSNNQAPRSIGGFLVCWWIEHSACGWSDDSSEQQFDEQFVENSNSRRRSSYGWRRDSDRVSV